MADTADLVVLGAYFGTGSKGGVMSVFLMGCIDKAGKWRTVCKVRSLKTKKKKQTNQKKKEVFGSKSLKYFSINQCGNGHDDAAIARINRELESKMIKISCDPDK